MRQFRFLGDPSKYQWEIPLEHGKEYAGDLCVFGTVTLEKVIDLGKDPNDPEFEQEWKEVGNG